MIKSISILALLVLVTPGAAFELLQDPVQAVSGDLSSADEEERLDAVVALSALRSPAAVPALTSALRDPSRRVRAAAATGLAAAAASDALSTLADSLQREKDVYVRKAIVYSLGDLRDRRATPILDAALNDKNAEVRGAAAHALSQYADPSAVARLIKSLSDGDAFVRSRAAAALGTNAKYAQSAVPALIVLLSLDEDSEVKRQIAGALGAIGDKVVLKDLERARRSADPYLSQAAAKAIRRINATSPPN